MKPLKLAFAVVASLLAFLALGQAVQGQQASTPQPLNASVSDFGTSFIIDPPPICAKCVETELGFESADSSRTMPAVVTVAPFNSHTDFSVLVDLLDSESSGGDRTIQFGNRFDFVVRQQVLAKGNFVLVLFPRGTLFTRGAGGGRAGLSVAPQYSSGRNLIAANFNWTGAVGVSAANPRSDYQGSFDYFRSLDERGTTLFLGFTHEVTLGTETVGTEAGLEIPFRNGQVELEAGQLDLNTSPEWQFQARVIANWGKILGRK